MRTLLGLRGWDNKRNNRKTSKRTLSYDFAFGAMATLGAVALHQIWRLFYNQSLARIEDVANRPVSRFGDENSITVVGDNEADTEYAKGVSDISPFVIRVEAYLRLLKLPYVKKTTADMSENPRHKIPFANIKGTIVDDSSRIIATIQEKFTPVSEKLTEEQMSQGHLIRTMLLDSLYFVMSYETFQTTAGRKLVREALKERAKAIPAFLRPLVCWVFFKSEHANLYGQGYGRYPEADIIKKGQDNIQALATAFGENKFILGTKEATVYDTDVYAFMCYVFSEPFISLCPWAGELKEKNPNLVEHVDRMKQILYP